MSEVVCTCNDYACPNHISNNQGSCSRCIAKCQAAREIPSCFFNMIATREEIAGDYSFAGFARLVQAKAEK